MDKEHIIKLMKIFSDCGIKHAFGVAGGGASLRLITSLERSGIEYYPAAHEAAAALMAGACCRDGKTRAVAISIKGPGFVNLIPGTLSNFYEGRPAVTVSEAYGDNDPSYCMHKRIDHYRLISLLVKGYSASACGGAAVRRLLNLAQQEFPGPVHIDLCGMSTKNAWPVASEKKRQDNRKKIETILNYIRKSRRPVVVLGSVVSRQAQGFPWQDARVPVVTTASAKGCIDERNDYSAGVITGETGELSPENMVLEQADLVIAFGLRNTEVVRAKKFSAPLFIIDVVEGRIHDGFGAKGSVAVTDLRKEAKVLCAALAQREWGKDAVARYHTVVKEELLADAWSPAVAFKSLESIAPANSILVPDTGLFCTVAEVFWRAASADNFCGSSNGRFMGTAIPTAIGAAIASAPKPVVCVCGDGGVRPYFPELRLAVENKLPILFILMSDGRYGTVAVAASKEVPSKAFAINGSSWWRAAEAIGCLSSKVSDVTQAERAIANWKSAKRPLFIEMSFDAQLYGKMTKRLR